MSFNANTLYRAVDIDLLAKECSDAIKGRSSKRPFFCVPDIQKDPTFHNRHKDSPNANNV
jgi:hypothetical protein